MRLSRRVTIFPVCAILLLLSGCGLAFPAAEGKFERTLTVTGPVELDVSTGSGSVEVRAGGSSVVQIHGTIRAGDSWRANAEEAVRYLEANPPIEQEGNSIRIGRIENDTYRNHVSISYEIVVPAETLVHSRTGSGSQKAEGVRGPIDAVAGSGSIVIRSVAGNVNARTGSGSIQLDEISGSVSAHAGSGSIRAGRIAGAATARTGSGNLMVEQTQAERGSTRDVDVSTGSGSIEVSGVSGPLHAKSSSGRITVSGTPAGDWELDASSGHVTLHLNADAAFDLNAHASSGRITVDHPVTVMGSLTRHELKGKVRGGGHRIDVHTSSGGITIR